MNENEITCKLFIYKSYVYPLKCVCKQITDITLLLLHNNTWNHLTVCKQISSGSFKYVSTKCVYKSYI